MYIIDPPNVFSSLEKWEDFLVRIQELAAVEPEDELIQDHLQMALDEIAKRKEQSA